jgi:hypothetical protein
MGWIEDKSVWFFLPTFTDEFVDGKTAKSLQSFGEIVCGDEVGEVGA